MSNKLQEKTVSVTSLQIVPNITVTPFIQKILNNLQSAVRRIDIYENMFQPGLTGQVYLRDTASITNIALLRGLDFLRLQFATKNSQNGNLREFGTIGTNGQISPFLFAIYNQTDRIPTSKNSEEYTLGICSPELITSMQRKFSRSYNNKYPHDIIKEIVTNDQYGFGSDKPFVTRERSKSRIKLVVPYLRPLEVIQLLTMQGQSSSGGATNYMFFETLEGYHYTSFNGLLDRAKRDTEIPYLYIDLAGSQDGNANTTRLIKAEQLQVVSGFDIFYATSRGYFASTTIAPDVLSGVCGIEMSGTGPGFGPAQGRPSYNDRNKINPNGLDFYPPLYGIQSSPTARTFLVPTTAFSAANTKITSQDDTITDNGIAQTLDARNRELLGLQLRTIRGVVAGVPELHAGKLIDVEFPNPLANKVGNAQWDFASGRYLIINAKHSIVGIGDNKFLYETTFEAVTDSFARSRPQRPTQ